jgi:hypothetical protein
MSLSDPFLVLRGGGFKCWELFGPSCGISALSWPTRTFSDGYHDDARRERAYRKAVEVWKIVSM